MSDRKYRQIILPQLVLLQTTRETPTPRATHVKPSVVEMISDQGGRVLEVAMTLRSEVIIVQLLTETKTGLLHSFA